MTSKLFCILVLAAFSLAACQSSDEGRKENSQPAGLVKDTSGTSEPSLDIPYATARNYFVKNTVAQGPLAQPKIETQENFDALFGAAAHMGADGKPTVIDFSKQYVIAVVGDETDKATELSPLSLQRADAKQVVFSYRLSRGGKQSYTIRPVLIVVVDKTNDGAVVLRKEVQE